MRTTANHPLALASLLMVAMMGASILTLLPLWVGALTDLNLYSQQQIGWLAAADVVGIFAASASAIVWVRRLAWRPTLMGGLGLFLMANLLCLLVTDVAALMALRVVAGLGCGAAYAVALAGLGDHERPDFAFGLMVTAQVVFGTLGFFWAPGFIAEWGIDGFFHYLNLWLLATLMVCFLCTPSSNKAASESAFALKPLLTGNALLVFATTVVYYLGVSAVWAYLERLGVSMGLTGEQVGDWLGTGFAISGAGSFVAAFIGRVTGKLAAFSGALVLQTVAIFWLMGDPLNLALVSLYAVSTIVFQFFWSFAVPLLMDRFNSVDASGRLIVLCASAFKIGEILGPPMAAALIVEGNYTPVLWLGVVAFGISWVLFSLLEMRLKNARVNHA